MTWHLEQESVDRYLLGKTVPSTSASVEAHLQACPECRGLLDVDPQWVERSWADITYRLEEPQRTPLERALSFLPMRANSARIVAQTPSLHVNWLLAILLVLGLAVLLGYSTDDSNGDLLIGVLAPVLPVIGVAFAFGSVADPSFEIVAATPIDKFHVLLLRSAVVTATTLILSLLVGLLMPTAGLVAFWILPALALTIVTLSLGSRMALWRAAIIVLSFWVLAAVTASLSSAGLTLLFAPGSQAVSAVIVLVGLVTFFAIKDDFNRKGIE